MTQEAKKTDATETTDEVKATETTAKTAKAPAEWQGSFSDLGNTQRSFKITEADGTTIDVNFKWPGKKEAENVQGKVSSQVADANGNRVIRATYGDYHEALFAFFGKPVVNGTVGKENISWAFFDKHSNKTYDYLMEEADSFLGLVADAD